ncbi:uncharacterized, partial [Tachysurus ichikawai]
TSRCPSPLTFTLTFRYHHETWMMWRPELDLQS